MRLIIFCAVCFLFSCCTRGIIIGKYSAVGNPDYFQLNNDSTFLYQYNAFHAFEYSQGTWQKNKTIVLLNSTIKTRLIPLKVVEATNVNDNVSKLSIKIQGKLKPENYKCEIFINDTLFTMKSKNQLQSTGLNVAEAEKEVNTKDLFYRYIRGDSLSLLELTTPLNSIFLKIIQEPLTITSTNFSPNPLQTESYYPKSNKIKDLTTDIVINDSLFAYKIFNNVKLVTKKNGLLFYEPVTNQKHWVPRFK